MEARTSQRVKVVRDLEMGPRTALVSPLKPDPSGMKRNADAVEVPNANPSKLHGVAHTCPVDLALPAMRALAASPKEPVFKISYFHSARKLKKIVHTEIHV